MPSAPLTPKQEAFARAYVETSNASEAYRRCYAVKTMSANAIGVEAHRVLTSPKVALKIRELQERNTRRHEYTVDRLAEMAQRAYELAMKDDVQSPSAAVAAVMAIGKLHGLVVDKKEVTKKRDASDLADAELYAIAGLGRPRAIEAQGSSEELDCVHPVHLS